MSRQKIASWFLSEAGRKFAFGCATFGGVGAFCLNYVPNTFLLTKYQEVVHLYKNGVAVPVPKYLTERFNKTLKLAEVPENIQDLYTPFSVVGFDIFSAGSAKSRFGCIIGLPVNFTYENVDTIDRSNIKIQSESVVWEKQEAKEFLDSQVLSEKAQIFAIAREIKMTQTFKLLLDSVFATAGICLTYGLSNTLNTRFNMYAKPVSVRLTLYMLVSAFVLTNYVFIKDFMQLYYEHKVDEELKHTNPIFIEGAIEFYEKLLKRNRALRKLMGSEGESLYSVLGNENYLFRQRHLPIVQRKAYFESKLDPKESVIKNIM